MVFEEMTKTVVFAILGSGFLMAMVGKFLDERHVPMKVFFYSLAILMIPLSIGIGLRGLEEQDTGSTAEQAIIDMTADIYYVDLWIFYLILSFFFVLLIIWVVESMRRSRENRMKKDLTPKLT